VTEHTQGGAVDESRLPRLDRAPVAHSPEQAQAYGLNRHPSLEDVGRRTLMWNPEVLQAYSTLSNYLRDSTCLSARDREIAILRQAWDSGSDYQWAMHARMALNADLTTAEVERIARGPGSPDWAPHEVAIMRAVDELHRASRVSDQTWDALRAHYDERQVIELLVLVGSYRLLAYVLNSVGIRPPDGQSPTWEGNTFLFTE
jgi:4-carboxymuconolactone decarboxylase